MGYLLPTEYVQYGLTSETTDDWVTMASAMIDGHCRRPSLLVTEYVERMRVMRGAASVLLSYRPLAPAEGASSPVVSLRARYGLPVHGGLGDVFRDEIASAFGVAGSWSSLDIEAADVNAVTGELMLPGNFLGLSYSEIEVTYTAGLVTIPPAVKVACAQVVRNAQATPALNVKSSRMDTLQMQYFSASLIDAQVQTLLRPYVAQRVG